MLARFAVVYLSLVAIAGVLVWMRNRRPSLGAPERRAMWRTYGIAVGFSFVVLLAGYLHRLVLAAMLVPLIAIGLWEFSRVAGGFPKTGAVLGTGVALAALAWGPSGQVVAIAITGAVLLAAPLFASDLGSASRASAVTLVGAIYLGFMGSHMLLFGEGDAFFPRFAFFFLLLYVNDAFAQLWGQLIGGRSIVPTLSPNKTVAGSTAALLSTVAVGHAIRFLVPELGPVAVTVVSALLSVAGQLGDLVASGFKRVAGVKDYGSWLPAFGGVMDRFDSLFFAAPFFAYLVSPELLA